MPGKDRLERIYQHGMVFPSEDVRAKVATKTKVRPMIALKGFLASIKTPCSLALSDQAGLKLTFHR